MPAVDADLYGDSVHRIVDAEIVQQFVDAVVSLAAVVAVEALDVAAAVADR